MKEIQFEQINQIGVITIKRPEARNAFNWAMLTRFAELVTDIATNVAADPSLRALIITGHGDMFVAGGDIKDHDTSPESGAKLNRIMGDALDQLTHLSIPTIAAINGSAFGGGWEIMTACDLRVMADTATLNFVQAKVGLTTGWGGTARLVHLIGVSQAQALLLTAATISAEAAQQINLVQYVVPPEQVMTKALALTDEISRLPSNAVTALKALVWQSTQQTLAAGYAAETEQFIQAYTHPNHGEAVAAFKAKRRPQFE